MKIKIIACRVLKNELEQEVKKSSHTIDFSYIEAGLHDRPLELREKLQSEINTANKEEYDYIIVGYGLCGRGTIGITTLKIPVVIPRCHDCIALFLGNNKEYFKQFSNYPGTYYLSTSWFEEKALPQMSRKSSIFQDEGTFEKFVEKYGKENAEFIYEFYNRWKKNYKRVAFISTGVHDEEHYKALAKEFASENKLLYEEINSEMSLLHNLISGTWNENDFLILRSGFITMMGDMNVITSVPLNRETVIEDVPELTVQRKRIKFSGDSNSGGNKIGLGIDAGGTYTDAVIFDFTQRTVLSKAKALTTKYDLKEGILNSIDQLDISYFPKIRKVALSTTLATNAIVEQKTRPVGLLVMGLEKSSFNEIIFKPKELIKGQIDISGNILEPIDPDEVVRVTQSFIDAKNIQAIAISGFGSVINPLHEQEVKEIISKHFSLPVICGHELSMQLDCTRRANTSVLNAQLIPIMTQLITALQQALIERNFIQYEFDVVRGDGTLVNSSYAIEYPVQTILSGPAASCIGSLFLTNAKNGLMIDIGGTTSDIVLIEDGLPSKVAEGAEVGGIRTNISTLDITTHGLGGDSYIQFLRRKTVEVGPRRVVPISLLAQTNVDIIEQLEELLRLSPFPFCLNEPVDFFIYGKRKTTYPLNEMEQQIVETVQERPISRWHLSKKTGAPDPSLLPVESLENSGIIERSGLTPTDVLLSTGQLNSLDSKASLLAIKIYEKMLHKTSREITEEILTTIHDKLSYYAFTKALKRDIAEEFSTDLEQGRLFHTLFIRKTNKNYYSINFGLGYPLIGIGAPAKAYLPEVSKTLRTNLIVPEHFEVANAIGAIVGKIMTDIEVLIRVGDFKTYTVSSENNLKVFQSLADATHHAYQQAETIATHKAREMGAHEIELSVFHETLYGTARDSEVFLQRTVKARAMSVNSEQ